ncbi:MAG: intracellular septation protein [Sphingomonadales bacterium]|nr:intracellular septation protein [Sphingomonadales bacterium]
MSVTAETEKREPSVAARLLIDLGPLLVFFLVNFFAPVPDMLKIFYATGAFMAAMIVAMMISYLRYRHISPLLWFSGIMVVILGGVTIWLHNDVFIKMKPTLYYVLIASILGFGLATGRNLLKMVLGAAYPGLSERGWKLLTRNWAVFFVVMAVVNEAVWRNSSTSFWIGFKLWGFLPATFLFAIANVPMLMKHGMVLEKGKEEPPVPPSQ